MGERLMGRHTACVGALTLLERTPLGGLRVGCWREVRHGARAAHGAVVKHAARPDHASVCIGGDQSLMDTCTVRGKHCASGKRTACGKHSIDPLAPPPLRGEAHTSWPACRPPHAAYSTPPYRVMQPDHALIRVGRYSLSAGVQRLG